MRVGIVAEGPADIAVLKNILKGWLDLEGDDVVPIRPELARDETDAAGYRDPPPGKFSNWELVLKECDTCEGIGTFLDNVLDDDMLVVVQIDTAEADLPKYGVTRPNRKASGYVDQLRSLVVARINSLLKQQFVGRIRHAVSVEETDAWLLALHDDNDKNTCALRNPKGSFLAWQKKNRIKKSGRTIYEHYRLLSAGFRARKKLESAAGRNRSLRLFIDSLP